MANEQDNFSIPDVIMAYLQSNISFFSIRLNTHMQFVQFKNSYNKKNEGKNKTVLHTIK